VKWQLTPYTTSRWWPPSMLKRLALTLMEREEISRGLIDGDSLRVIAASLGRAPSTVSREVARNGGLGQYRAAASEKCAWVRALRPKLCKLATHPPLRRVVARLLRPKLVAATDRRVAKAQPSR
jgi:IS30 family transposase